MIRLEHGRYFGTAHQSTVVRGLRFTTTTYDASTTIPLHYHDRPYVCLVRAGGFRERSGAREVECGVGSVVLHAAGERHHDRFGPRGGMCTNLAFDDTWIERLQREGLPLNRSAFTHGGPTAWVSQRIETELVRSDDLSELALESLAVLLMSELSRAPRDGRTRPAWLDRVEARLRDDFRTPPTLHELARDAGVSRAQLARMFGRYVGCSVGSYVRRLRIDWAAQHLRAGAPEPLSQLALAAGFADQAHFTRAFKRITGQTPARYRRVNGS